MESPPDQQQPWLTAPWFGSRPATATWTDHELLSLADSLLLMIPEGCCGPTPAELVYSISTCASDTTAQPNGLAVGP